MVHFSYPNSKAGREKVFFFVFFSLGNWIALIAPWNLSFELDGPVYLAVSTVHK